MKRKKREAEKDKFKIDEERRLLYASVATDDIRKKSKKKIDWKQIGKKSKSINDRPPEIRPDEDESRLKK